MTVTGRTVGENIDGRQGPHPRRHPLAQRSDLRRGRDRRAERQPRAERRVIKPAAAEPRFLKHRGQALAFENYDHMMREIERDDLDVTPDHILVLKNAGPKGGPGMPEWGMLPIPQASCWGRACAT